MAVIADLGNIQARQLGLPPVAIFRLSIHGQGTLTSPRFRFQWQLINIQGRPVMGLQRTGVLLSVGDQNYTLLNPLYPLIQGMEEFNAIPSTDMDARMLCWADLKQLLPDDVVVDQHLQSLNIVRADAFTLELGAGDSLDPVLLNRPPADPEALDTESEPRETLPSAVQTAFAGRFHARSDAQARYAMPGNWFVVVPEQLREALKVVRKVQDAPATERRAFIANPQAALRQHLEAELDDSVVEHLFIETPAFLSERVQCLGEWRPKVCAYVSSSGQDWLPPEDQVIIGIPIDNGVLKVTPNQLPPLLEELEAAREQGKAAIEFENQTIAASPENIAAIERVAPPLSTSTEKDQTPTADETPAALVPLILDNIEEIEFQQGHRQRPGAPGGLPAVLKSRFFKHQQLGYEWLQQHWCAGSPGALLADDMGLGKTLQTSVCHASKDRS